MNTTARLSLVAVAIAMVTGVLVGTLVSTDEAEAATQHTLRIPAAAFRPADHDTQYGSDGRWLGTYTSGTPAFQAPVLLQGNSATIHSVKLHYWDSGPGEVCASVYRINMKTTAKKRMSVICTRNAVEGYRTRNDTTIQPDTVSANQGVYVWVTLPSGSYGVVGVTITYTSDV